jgi:hypothetical protein
VKTVRVVSYAINGRGLGHLVRQLAILRWVRRLAPALGVRCEAWVLTSSEGDTLARREGVPAIKLPSKAMLRDAGIEPARYLAIARSWVVNAVSGLAPDVLVVDTFPGGSFGELVAALELAPRRVLVARAVKDEIAGDDAYRALLPLYDATIVPDERGVGPILLRERQELLGRAEARAALGVPDGARAVYVTLGGGGDEVAPHALPWLVDALVPRGWHVVVGAGPLYTGVERRGPGITWIDRYVPLELLAGVDAAVSAGGYNSVTELMYAGVPTVFLPQPRLADDQAARARAAADAGAGRLAARLEDVPVLLDDAGSRDAALALVPRNGARDAAVAVLAQVLPRADVEHAASLFAPRVLDALRMIGGRALDPADRRIHEVLRVVAAPSPTDAAHRAAVLAELADEGAVISVPPRGPATTGSSRVERFLDAAATAGAPWDETATIVLGLRKVFPAASADELTSACVELFAALARFGDWMGAVSLIRALPVQRGYAPGKFVADLRRWLAREDDLFDALRTFTQLEGAGKRPLPDVLHSLGAGDA